MIKGFSLDIYDCDIAFAWDTNEKELNGLLDRAEATDADRKDFFDHIKAGNPIDVCYSIVENYYRGTANTQLRVKDLRDRDEMI